jgi:hypothetical protein
VHHSKFWPPMTGSGQIRSFGDVGSMSGLPESGQGWATYEYATQCGNLVVLPPGHKSPPTKCRDPSAAAPSPTAAGRGGEAAAKGALIFFEPTEGD